MQPRSRAAQLAHQPLTAVSRYAQRLAINPARRGSYKPALRITQRCSYGASVSPLLANIYLHHVFDLWAHPCRTRHAHGDVVITRFADDFVVGFEHQEDAERFWADLRDRLAKFGLELNAEKTRLIEFGRHAARDRKARGLGKPETFQFLGFTHICAKTRKSGRFKLRRITNSKRMRAKLLAVKDEMWRRMHLPVPEQGRWLARAPVRALQLLRGARQHRSAQRLPLPDHPALVQIASATQPETQAGLDAATAVPTATERLAG
jgi:hypothetical protein